MPDEFPIGVESGDAQYAERRRSQGIGPLMFSRQFQNAPESGNKKQGQQSQHQPQPGIAVVAGGLCVFVVGKIGEVGSGEKLRGKIGVHPAAVTEQRSLVRQRPGQFGQVQPVAEGKCIQKGGKPARPPGQIQHGIGRAQEKQDNKEDGRRVKFSVIAENAGGINKEAQGYASQGVWEGGPRAAREGNEDERQSREQADAPFSGGSHAVCAKEKTGDGQEMGGKIFVSEQSDVADFRAEQGIIRSEPGGFRSRYVLIPPQQGIQQPQCRSQYGKNTLFPVSGSGIRSRREHDDGRGDKAQIRYALIIKPGGKPCPDKEIAASQPQGQPARQSGAGNLVSPENTEAEQQEGCRQKAGGKEKGVPFPACRRRCQEDVKKGQQARQNFPGGSFSNARSGGGAGGRVWHGWEFIWKAAV